MNWKTCKEVFMNWFEILFQHFLEKGMELNLVSRLTFCKYIYHPK
jgi:hypothetical protein